MRVVDFFCGAGGFSEGFRQAGFEIVFAVDKWEPAVTTYRGNKPSVNVVLDDVVRIAYLDDEEFNRLVPDAEIIIGSPPCQAFSQSNKSGNGDKTQGIVLIEAYLRIVARKKFKRNSVLKYWVLENVPNSRKFIKEEYTAEDLDLQGDFVLKTRGDGAGIYNAKYFGAPTNRKRFLCGDFPKLEETHNDDTVINLGEVLRSLGDPLAKRPGVIKDVNYPGFEISRKDVTDYRYIHELAPFEWEAAKRLKLDKGYMGKMSFPENLKNPARTIMATSTASSREAMVIGYKSNRYRLPTVREVASLMSFPLDYRFYGLTKGIKQTLVGNAVPPKLSYAVAVAIGKKEGLRIQRKYVPIKHNTEIKFVNLNGIKLPLNEETPRRDAAKFKYHIPYLIVDAYRVELTNYYSDFNKKKFKWVAEIHHGQGKDKAIFFSPDLDVYQLDAKTKEKVDSYLEQHARNIATHDEFQLIYCKTSEERKHNKEVGPYELLSSVREFIDDLGIEKNLIVEYNYNGKYHQIPLIIWIGYYILSVVTSKMSVETRKMEGGYAGHR